MMKRLRKYSVWGALAVSLTLPAKSHAGFVRAYAVTQFTVINVNADGTFITNDGGISAILTGGNNGSDFGGTTTAYIRSGGNGWVQFHYSYSSDDLPFYDWAGYILDTEFFPLADTHGQAGSAAFQVLSGQVFGFRVYTYDNTHEPGILTISNFDAPAAVPEPGTLSMAAAALAAICGLLLRSAHTSGRNRT